MVSTRQNILHWETYREHQINYIHQAQDDIADLGLVVAVATNQEQAGDNVVGEHLPMVLSALLDVDNHNLLQPETELSQIVEFEEASHGACRETRPHGRQVVEVWRFVDEILVRMLAFASHGTMGCEGTHCSKEPERGIVQDQPCLFGKANGSLLLVNPALSGHWDKGIVHGGCAEAGEDYDAKRDKLQVLPPWVVEAGLGVIVRKGEVLNC